MKTGTIYNRASYVVPLFLCLALAACDSHSGRSPKHAVADIHAMDVGLLKLYCAQCHAPPSPRLHQADEWSAVVMRMEHHRLDARMPPVPDAARKQLLAWLQAHAHPSKRGSK